jgi:glycosyltransferase involved in cell wall biosynthesis
VAKARPDAHFVICGDGPMRDEMNKYAAELGIADRVHLPGAQSNIGSWFKLMDVVMLTSRHEGLPNVLLEAQSLGVPVVAPDVGGMAEVVEQGQTGWTIKQADAAMLAERVLYCLTDQQWRQAAVERAPRFVRERFGIETMLHRNLEVYGVSA